MEKQRPTWAVEPTESWNYGIVLDREDPSKTLSFEQSDEMPEYPWSADSVSVRLRGNGKRLPQWNEYHGDAGPLPPSPVDSDEPEEEIELIPYGATALRVSELPVIRA